MCFLIKNWLNPTGSTPHSKSNVGFGACVWMVWRCCIARRALSSHHHKGRPLCRQRHRLDCLRRLKGEKERKKGRKSLGNNFFFPFSPFFFNIHISIRYTAVRLCLCRRLLKKTRSGSQKGKGGPSPNTEHTNTSTTEYNKLHACPPALAAQMASARPEHPAC